MFEHFISVTLSLLNGFQTTLEIFALTLLFALPLGLIIAFGSMNRVKVIKWIVKAFVWIIRGTPLMLQLIVIYYGPGLVGEWAKDMVAAGSTGVFYRFLANWSVFDRFLAVMIAFVINYACYFSEIYRGGIESISKGQYEAGQVLGLTKVQVFFKVVLLQVIKRIIPPMSNEIITLVKDTSLARIIMVYEIIWSAQQFIKSEGLLWPLFYTGAFYLAFSGLLTLLFGYAEKRLNYFRS
ncbi:MAG: amino acid ABC transporter permease [Clostridia bacterium]|nr:amino acid ABC transporter permease [Clostridia bacterium]